MTLENAKTGLNEKQIDLLVSLVKLGDSVELALETVVETADRHSNTEFYYNAYNI